MVYLTSTVAACAAFALAATSSTVALPAQQQPNAAVVQERGLPAPSMMVGAIQRRHNRHSNNDGGSSHRHHRGGKHDYKKKRALININGLLGPNGLLNLGGPDDYVVVNGNNNKVSITRGHHVVTSSSKEKRAHAPRSSPMIQVDTNHKSHRYGGDSLRVQASKKRDTSPPSSAGPYANAMPGFVEVASTLLHTNLAKSVAGLVFSKDPNSNSSDFSLGTSNSQATHFYLLPIEGFAPVPTSTNSSTLQLAATSFNGSTPSNSSISDSPTPLVQMYQLRVPVLDSQTLQANDYCATFDTKPPSPLSMQPCGLQDGFSQAFTFDNSTSQLVPVYPPASVAPGAVNAAIKIGQSPAQFAADVPSNSSWVVNGTASSTFTSSSAAPSSTSGSDASGKVQLFFVSSSGLDSMSSDSSSGDSSIPILGAPSLSDATMATAALPTSVFEPNLKAANVDSTDGSDSTVTVTVTTTAASPDSTSSAALTVDTSEDGSSSNSADADASNAEDFAPFPSTTPSLSGSGTVPTLAPVPTTPPTSDTDSASGTWSYVPYSSASSVSNGSSDE